MTLIEVLIATAIFVVISFTLFEVIRHFMLSTQRISTQQHQRADISHLLDELESDQQSADAVFIPATDVLGNSNANPHEVDFYAKDGSNRPYYWAYLYNAAAHTLTRYNYGSPGSAPIQAGSPIIHVVAFTPGDHQISEVTSAASPIYLPIFTGAANYNVPLSTGAGVQGGTHVVHIDLATNVEKTSIDVSTTSAPSGFTVVLNYTPRPSPTPGALKTWPNAVVFATTGKSLTYARPANRAFDLAALLNGLLGGGIAEAATGTCSAIAYADAGPPPWSTVDANNPGANGLSTDAQGCLSFNGNATLVGVVASQTNYTRAFQPINQNCGLAISFGAWNPVAGTGPQAELGAAGASPISSCYFTISGAGSQPLSVGHGQVNARVIDAGGSCSDVGEVCVLSFAWPTGGNASCDPSTGATSSDWTDSNYSFVISAGPGTGTITNDGTGAGTFMRRGVGSVTITAHEGYQSWTATLRKSGGYSCSAMTTIKPAGSLTIN